MNQNGTVVLRAIEDLAEPVTFKTIVDYIAEKAETTPDQELKDTVKDTLDGGVRFGYLQKTRGKYFATPKIDLNIDDDDIDVDEEEMLLYRERTPIRF